jgi:2-oxoglutarate dehydrogenase E2 component (dihydrolipoamide succinyltransferase)
MAIEIRVPALGESIVDAVIVKWLKQPGEPVARSEPLVELETDKVNVEVPAEQAGTMGEILRAENDTVAVGEILGTILPATGDVIASSASVPQPVAASESAAAPELAEAAALATLGAALAHRAGPAVRRLAAEKAVDLTTVSGSGPGGRVLPDDVLRRTTPAAAPTSEAARAVPSASPAAPAISMNGREERVRMSRRRQSIAARLVEAQQTAAMLTTFNEVDMSAVMDLRKRRRDAFKERHGVGLGYMSFFTKACIGALRAFPRVNGEIQGDEIVLKHYYDIGIAVGVEDGLVVPVVRDADQKTFAEIEREVADLGTRARENKLTLPELQGGTFTITNGGIFGSLLSTPILNAPQSGILGMHKIQERPMAISGKIEIRLMMYLALSYDHRIVDGREAVTFLVRVKDVLEDPARLILDL